MAIEFGETQYHVKTMYGNNTDYDGNTKYIYIESNKKPYIWKEKFKKVRDWEAIRVMLFKKKKIGVLRVCFLNLYSYFEKESKVLGLTVEEERRTR